MLKYTRYQQFDITRHVGTVGHFRKLTSMSSDNFGFQHWDRLGGGDSRKHDGGILSSKTDRTFLNYLSDCMLMDMSLSKLYFTFTYRQGLERVDLELRFQFLFVK